MAIRKLRKCTCLQELYSKLQNETGFTEWKQWIQEEEFDFECIVDDMNDEQSDIKEYINGNTNIPGVFYRKIQACIKGEAYHTSTTVSRSCYDTKEDEEHETESAQCDNCMTPLKTQIPNTHALEQHIVNTAQERIDGVLRVVQLQQETYGESQAQDIYGLVEKEYANHNGIDGFIEDCGEYVMNIDSIYADNVNKCELDGCPCIQREFRDRNVYDKNVKERFELYSHCEDEKSVVIQQIVD
eukprot:879376_1